MARRTRRILGAFEDRIFALESRGTGPATATAGPIVTVPATVASQTVYTVPYATQGGYLSSGVHGIYYPPRATAPPAMSF
jgi:hypothetical protein